ncbi:transcriptional regulator [Haloarculaceae archaeon H-GB2-1]|nr:transcriptional regulator [Haloarculaceae archaeon H-GB1-1]MEA5388377.1 transcriptional regulator [Haloarculaceae archaeon H-GB11]MEA5406413.1 transcriptional regulator [Haloarculaceae archaeon H-GB2-1]
MDDIFDALANVHRRRLLVALLGHNPQQDTVRTPEDAHGGEKAVETLQKELYHTHLPKLEQAGFISWDQETREVRKGPRFDEIRPLLELMRDHADELPNDWL